MPSHEYGLAGWYVDAIDNRLSNEFKEFADLANPKPLTIAATQALLNDDEALVLFLDTPEVKPTPEETFIWVVTKTDVRWVRSDLGTAALTREVAALRCGLDATAWTARQCLDLTGKGYYRCRPRGRQAAALRSRPRPQALHGAVRRGQDLIKGKHLLIVPSGPLTQLAVPGAGDGTAQGDDHRSSAGSHASTPSPSCPPSRR